MWADEPGSAGAANRGLGRRFETRRRSVGGSGGGRARPFHGVENEPLGADGEGRQHGHHAHRGGRLACPSAPTAGPFPQGSGVPEERNAFAKTGRLTASSRRRPTSRSVRCGSWQIVGWRWRACHVRLDPRRVVAIRVHGGCPPPCMGIGPLRGGDVDRPVPRPGAAVVRPPTAGMRGTEGVTSLNRVRTRSVANGLRCGTRSGQSR